jgi:hypothetical protein
LLHLHLAAAAFGGANLDGGRLHRIEQRLAELERGLKVLDRQPERPGHARATAVQAFNLQVRDQLEQIGQWMSGLWGAGEAAA